MSVEGSNGILLTAKHTHTGRLNSKYFFRNCIIFWFHFFRLDVVISNNICDGL